jgi:hypothetical protein
MAAIWAFIFNRDAICVDLIFSVNAAFSSADAGLMVVFFPVGSTVISAESLID